MNNSGLKKIELTELEDKFTRDRERYGIFVAGPFINREIDLSDEENSGTISKKIRYLLVEHYIDLGHSVYLGEDVELRMLGEKHYGPKSNATFFERHYIKSVDALIVILDGPGAFCEFGDWATSREICEKMLVFIDKIHEGEKSYINMGTAKAAQHHGATIFYEDYNDFSSIKSISDKFIESLAIDARIEALYAR